jgi:hypothetical protein
MVLLLQIYGSLGCRIQSLLSGICWAEELQTTLEVYWWTMPQISHCPFETLFQLKSLPSFVTVKAGYIENATNIVSEEEFEEQKYPFVIKSKSQFYKRDMKKWIDYLKQLRPASHLEQRIAMTPSVNTIGIFEYGQKESCMAQILSIIWKEFRDIHQYLLSTDSHETKRFCQIMFRDTLYISNILMNPHHEKHYWDQIVNLFSFSKCLVILDCNNSELMKLSACIGDIKYIQIQ